MTPSVRRLALVIHVSSSVGWLGAVVTFLALAVAGVASGDAQLVRAAYLAMHLITWVVIMPLSMATLLTGVVESLGTSWGLFRHYWIVAKLVLTVVATLILLVHTQPIGQVAIVASQIHLASSDLRPLRVQLVADAGAALVALLVATTLSIYKPWGLTPFGRREEGSSPPGSKADLNASSAWKWFWLAGALAAVALFAYIHLVGGLPAH